MGTGRKVVLLAVEAVEALHSKGGPEVGVGMDRSSHPNQVVGLVAARAGTVHTEHVCWAAAAVEVTEPRVLNLTAAAPCHGLLRHILMMELVSGRGTYLGLEVVVRPSRGRSDCIRS